MFSIKVVKATGETKFVERGEEEVTLVATSAYEEGDRIVLEYFGEPRYFVFQADDAMGTALIYVKGNVDIIVPLGRQDVGIRQRRLRAPAIISVRDMRPKKRFCIQKSGAQCI